ncbi:unnamed protein product [Aphanomyces euteiches]
MDDIRFAELWGAAYPYCSLIPRDQLLCLDKETMMELMLAISYLSSRVGHYTTNVDSNARQNDFSEVFETMKMSETTRQIMLHRLGTRAVDKSGDGERRASGQACFMRPVEALDAQHEVH